MLTLGIDLGTPKVAAVLCDAEKTKPDARFQQNIMRHLPELPAARSRTRKPCTMPYSGCWRNCRLRN